jgi:hypothetical protein
MYINETVSKMTRFTMPYKRLTKQRAHYGWTILVQRFLFTGLDEHYTRVAEPHHFDAGTSLQRKMTQLTAPTEILRRI